MSEHHRKCKEQRQKTEITPKTILAYIVSMNEQNCGRKTASDKTLKK